MAGINTKRVVWVAVIIGVLLVGVAGVFAFSLGKYEKVKAAAGQVFIPVAKVSDGKAHFYRFSDGSKDIDFVVVKASDGSFKTAFDACDTCFHAKKGYEQQGKALVCQNCRRQFAIDRIGPHEVGGCNPSYLPSQLKGNNIAIAAGDLKAGGRFF
ncbi:MAG TPA: DUF2318 domain-containing protein [Geomonas sp.]|nr:DUF2318 domain-containing protein [Geomonas sp.]